MRASTVRSATGFSAATTISDFLARRLAELEEAVVGQGHRLAGLGQGRILVLGRQQESALAAGAYVKDVDVVVAQRLDAYRGSDRPTLNWYVFGSTGVSLPSWNNRTLYSRAMTFLTGSV